MTAAFDSRVEALKEAAVLRSLAEQVASPVVAGRKSRKALTGKQRSQWSQITKIITGPELIGFNRECDFLSSRDVAEAWQRRCRMAGIGTGLLGWFLWNWAFPLLIELAKRWIESRRAQQD